MDAYICIDYTNDFIADTGALTTKEYGQVLAPHIINALDHAQANGDCIIMAVDKHLPNDTYHPETALFPPHNITGTAGRLLFEPLHTWYTAHQKDVLWIDKTRYSAFYGTALDSLLRERHIHTVHLLGVCTDICILHTAIDAYERGYHIAIDRRHVASFDPQAAQWALSHMEHCLNASIY